jgi:prolipoprotein diacylglyceryl transferase
MSWDQVPNEWWGPFAIWEGGLGLPGGMALGVIVGLWRVRRAGASLPLFMDAGAPALLVAQPIGRVGNWFNQELFGKPTSLPWALEIDPEHRPSGYAAEPTFHPTLLYEIVWDLAPAAALVWIGHHRRIRPPGLFAPYVGGYGAFRMAMELLRVDPAHEVLGLRINLYVAAMLAIGGFVGFVHSQRKHQAAPTNVMKPPVARPGAG